jgi:hypothetical protein
LKIYREYSSFITIRQQQMYYLRTTIYTCDHT